MPIKIFGFQALWSPYLIAILVVVTIVYIVALKNKVTWKERINFLIGVTLFYIVLGSPIDLLSHILFSMHMTQMALLLLLTPIFFLQSIPKQLYPQKRWFLILTKPLIALPVFVTLFSIYHLPLVFDTIKMNSILHMLYTLLLFVSALFMYYPLVCSPMRGLLKVGYIIGNAVLITPACALIIFSSHPFYATYTDPAMWMQAMKLCVPTSVLNGLSLSGPELFTNMTPLHDQQLGGILMKVVQEVIFGILLGKVFFEWYRNEQKNADQLTQEALEERKRLYANEYR